jgi:hypothetical protein
MLILCIHWQIIYLQYIKHNNIIDSNEGSGLEVNAEKAKYMLQSPHSNAWHNSYMKVANRSFENNTLCAN